MQSNSVAPAQAAYGNYQPSVPISLYRELSSELQLTQAKLDALQLQNEQLARQNQLLIQEFAGLAKSSQQMQETIVRSGQQMQDAISQSSQKLQEVISPASGRSNGSNVKRTEAVARAKSEKQPTNNAVQRMQEVVAQVRPSSPIPPMPPIPQAMPQSSAQPLSAAMSQSIAQSDVAQAVAQAVAQRLAPEAVPPVQMPSFDPPSSPTPKLATHQEEIKKTISFASSSSSSVTGWWLFLTIVVIIGTSFGAGYFLMRPFVNNSK